MIYSGNDIGYQDTPLGDLSCQISSYSVSYPCVFHPGKAQHEGIAACPNVYLSALATPWEHHSIQHVFSLYSHSWSYNCIFVAYNLNRWTCKQHILYLISRKMNLQNFKKLCIMFCCKYRVQCKKVTAGPNTLPHYHNYWLYRTNELPTMPDAYFGNVSWA